MACSRAGVARARRESGFLIYGVGGLQTRQSGGGALAREVDEGFRRADARLAAAKIFHHLVVLTINFLAILAPMGEKSGLFLFSRRGDIYVIGRAEAQGLAAAIDLEVVEPKASAAGYVSAKRQNAGHLVIQVGID